MNLSPNVTLDMALHSDRANFLKIDNTTTDSHLIGNMSAVANNCFEAIKKQFPDAVISSFYRCDQLNKAVKGQSTSQHMKGQAIDIFSSGHIPNLVALTQEDKAKTVSVYIRKRNLEILNWCKTNLKFDQLLNEFPDANGCPAWVHISFNNNGVNRQQFFVIK